MDASVQSLRTDPARTSAPAGLASSDGLSAGVAATPRDPSVGVLALTIDGWSTHWTSRHQVLTRLATYYHVSWLQPPVGWRDTAAAAQRRGQLLHGPDKPPLLVRQPELWLPKLYRPEWLARHTASWRLNRARAELVARGCSRIVLYVWNPAFSDDVDRVPHDMCLYHIVDEYSFADEEQPTSEDERALIVGADEVIVHSPGLMEKKGGLNPRTVVIPNGVDYHAFATPSPEPADLAKIPHPRIGYAGYIKRHVDWALVARLARRHPAWSWVIVGGERSHELGPHVRDLSSLSNVYFLGEKPTSAVAAYPQHFDVCVMPYRMTAYTKYIYPLKLHEYLATGRPVVGTRIRSLEAFSDVIALAETDDEWSGALTAALQPSAQTAAARAARQAVARNHDWWDIVARIAGQIEIGLARAEARNGARPRFPRPLTPKGGSVTSPMSGGARQGLVEGSVTDRTSAPLAAAAPLTAEPGRSRVDAIRGDSIGVRSPLSPRHPDVGVLAVTVESWGSQWMTSHQVLPRLAEYFQVCWVQPAHPWRGTLAEVQQRVRAARGPLPPPPYVRDGEVWLPKLYRPTWLADRFAWWRLDRARAQLLRQGCRRIVLYVWDPAFARDIARVRRDLFVYHVVDEYSFAEHEQPNDPVELALITGADELIVHSPALMEKKGALNSHSALIPNGVDYRAFATPVPEPADLARIPGPRIGYTGYIKRQLDWELIEQLARRHVDWSWVFVGGARQHELGDAIRTVSTLPNVHFLGEKPAWELAAYPQHFDVCIMPYRLNAYTRYIYPLKLHEYLASGRPVVGSRIRSLEAFSQVVTLASGVDEWSAALRAALLPNAQGEAARAARQEIAREHDWDRLVARIAERIESGLARVG